MAGYLASNLHFAGQQPLSTVYKSLVNLLALVNDQLRRQRIMAFTFSVDGTPADNTMICDVSRSTSIGTGTEYKPTRLDAADGVMGGLAIINFLAEPTIDPATSRTEGWAFNQRTTVRWVAFPGKGLIVPAVHAAGLAFRLKSPAYTGTAVCDVLVDE